jgi:hypothetical protein
LEAHGFPPLQNAATAVLGRPSSQITHERNPGPNGRLSQPTGVNSKPRRVPEDDVSEGSTEYDAKFAAPHSSSEGEVASLEHERIMQPERQPSVSLTAQSERDQRIAQLTDDSELALKSALLEQVKANAADRARLELREHEDRLRLTDAEKDLIKSKAEADTLRAQTGDETRMLSERVRVLEGGVASKWWNEKSIESMECRNEG